MRVFAQFFNLQRVVIFLAASSLYAVCFGQGTAQQPAPVPHSQPPALPEHLRNQPPELPAQLPDSASLMEQFKMLEEFLQLPPDQLARMRQTIEIIERMSDDDRARMRVRIQHMRVVSPQTDQQLRWVLQQMPPGSPRRDAAQFWLGLSEESRQRLWTEWQTKTDESERRALVQAAVRAFVLQREDRVKDLQFSLAPR